MYHMVMLILVSLEHSAEVLDKWEELGVSGVTIMESAGLGRVREMMRGEESLPLLPALKHILQSREEHNRTLITVVDDEEMVDQLINATVEIVGDLTEPNRGVIFVLPVSRVIGIPV